MHKGLCTKVMSNNLHLHHRIKQWHRHCCLLQPSDVHIRAKSILVSMHCNGREFFSMDGKLHKAASTFCWAEEHSRQDIVGHDIDKHWAYMHIAAAGRLAVHILRVAATMQHEAIDACCTRERQTCLCRVQLHYRRVRDKHSKGIHLICITSVKMAMISFPSARQDSVARQ